MKRLLLPFLLSLLTWSSAAQAREYLLKDGGFEQSLPRPDQFTAPGPSVLYLKIEHAASRPTVYAWFPARFGIGERTTLIGAA